MTPGCIIRWGGGRSLYGEEREGEGWKIIHLSLLVSFICKGELGLCAAGILETMCFNVTLVPPPTPTLWICGPVEPAGWEYRARRVFLFLFSCVL